MLAAQMCNILSHFSLCYTNTAEVKECSGSNAARQGPPCFSSGCITFCEHVWNDVSPAEVSLLGCCELDFTGRLLLLLDAVAAEWRV